MKLIERPLGEVLAAFRSSAPTPGGGSASALTAAVGASLLAMVASLPKHRAASEEDVDRLRAAGQRSAALSERLAMLVDEDAAAYGLVMTAFRMPKASESEKTERSARIQQAFRAATEVPFEVMRHSAEAIEVAAVVAAFGNANAASDIGVAVELLLASARGAKLNVEINLPNVKDGDYVDSIRRQVSTLDTECDRGVAAARSRLAE